MSHIHKLPEKIVNRIAAGEVVERPANVAKELVENSIDAKATDIAVFLEKGGKTLIQVRDNGVGMDKQDLQLCIHRHATSKLPANASADLLNISTLGFRGEALPSIGAVSRLAITARPQHVDTATTIQVESGRSTPPTPAAGNVGTFVEVRDIFYKTPARLKFLKSDKSEYLAVADHIKRLAIAHPHISFSLYHNQRRTLHVLANKHEKDAVHHRLHAMFGKDFCDNILPVHLSRDGITIRGYAGLPTYHRASSVLQFIFVNGRPVMRDRLLMGVVRGAYADHVPKGRHPVVVLFIKTEPGLVDSNVHPTKAEVRFRDAATLRALLISSLHQAIASAGHKATTMMTQAITNMAVRPPTMAHHPQASSASAPFPKQERFSSFLPRSQENTAHEAARPFLPPPQELHDSNSFQGEESTRGGKKESADLQEALPLGSAKAQIHATYIIAQTNDGCVIVDQHAAHERIVYEKMKKRLAQNHVPRQALLIPEIVRLDEESTLRILDRTKELADLGFIIEGFGKESVVVREIPALLGQSDSAKLIHDMCDEIVDFDATVSLKERLEDICATIACHNSIRAGRAMGQEEMNALLRAMESTPHAGQCNHGRPTYVKLQLKDIESMFGRR